jgi:hypothetical protein
MSENKFTPVSYNTGNNLNSFSNLNFNNSPFSKSGDIGTFSHIKDDNYLKANYMSTSLDPDEQFVLDIIRNTKKESIAEMIDLLRSQESKSILLLRILERYQTALETKVEKSENKII